jgi:diguanylate cyclase (GGDEF)-like protein
MPVSEPSYAQPTSRQGELRALRLLLPIGAAVVVLTAAWEQLNGVMAWWDRWLYPLLVLVFGIGGMALWRWPQCHTWVRVSTVVTVNLYLMAVLLMVLFTGDAPLNQYTLLTTLVWLPFGYGLIFVMLAARPAMVISFIVALLTFTPIFVAMALKLRPNWGDEFTTTMPVLALSQLVYIVLLMAISDLRAGFHLASARLQVAQELALSDALTGVGNRRALQEHVRAGLSAAERGSAPTSIILMDIDHFKPINDNHGHSSGDQVLVQMAQLLTDQLRGSDRLGRWGGEEFMVVALATHMHAALELAERIRKAVAAFEFAHGDPVTLSLGVTQTLPGDTVDSLVHRADKALYLAKNGGRNRVEAQTVIITTP